MLDIYILHFRSGPCKGDPPPPPPPPPPVENPSYAPALPLSFFSRYMEKCSQTPCCLHFLPKFSNSSLACFVLFCTKYCMSSKYVLPSESTRKNYARFFQLIKTLLTSIKVIYQEKNAYLRLNSSAIFELGCPILHAVTSRVEDE